jgi:hypothetical protein
MPLKHFVTGQLVSQEMSQRVKELRQEMMPADRRLWQWLLDVFETWFAYALIQPARLSKKTILRRELGRRDVFFLATILSPALKIKPELLGILI